MDATAKSIGAPLVEAFELYRADAPRLLAACSVFVVPLALVKARVMVLLLTPTASIAVGDAGSFGAFLRFVASTLSVAVVYGLAVPMATAVSAILVADRTTGGRTDAKRAYATLRARLPALSGATALSFSLLLVGLWLLVVPGFLLAVAFMFVAPAVVLQKADTIAAFRRSLDVVRARAPQALVLFATFVAVHVVTATVVTMVVPRTEFFESSFVQDILLVGALPVPIVGTVLLYLDASREDGALDDTAIREAVAGSTPD